MNETRAVCQIQCGDGHDVRGGDANKPHRGDHVTVFMGIEASHCAPSTSICLCQQYLSKAGGKRFGFWKNSNERYKRAIPVRFSKKMFLKGIPFKSNTTNKKKFHWKKS